MYAVALAEGNGDSTTEIGCLVVLGVLGYILYPLVKHEWGYNSALLLHMGLNGGVAICWYLASQGKF